MTRRSLALLLAALGPLLMAPGAMAQGIPPEIVRTQNVTPEQLQQVTGFIEDAVRRLRSDDPREIKAGRDMLLSPFRTRDISVSFRQQYGRAVVERIAPFVQDAHELRAVNAIRVCGELATAEGLDAAVTAIGDSRVSVRYAAVFAVARTVDAIGASSPAITSDSLIRLMPRLRDVLRTDPDAIVALGAVEALHRAMNVERENFLGLRAAGLSALADGIRDRIQTSGSAPLPAELMQALIMAGQAARDALTANNPLLALNDSGIKRAAELNGYILGLVMRRLKAGDYPAGEPASRTLAVQAVAVAETAIGLAAQRAGVQVGSRGVAEDFRKATAAGDRDFHRKGLDLIGILQQPPFSFPIGTFMREDEGQPRP
jgi:hypothetical protein